VKHEAPQQSHPSANFGQAPPNPKVPNKGFDRPQDANMGAKRADKKAKQQARQERRENFRDPKPQPKAKPPKAEEKPKAGAFPPGHRYYGMTEEQLEAKLEADKLAKLHDPVAKAANKKQAIEKNRALIAKAIEEKAADAAARHASKKGAMPSGSANIPDPNAAGPSNHSEHHHHNTGHKHMHDDNFSTGL